MENSWAHHKLEVWQIAIDLVEDVYRLTGTFPADERFGLISQMRRTSVRRQGVLPVFAYFPRSSLRTGNAIAYRDPAGFGRSNAG